MHRDKWCLVRSQVAHKNESGSDCNRVSLFLFQTMKDFKNIIFDFGGVIINIDYHRIVRSFEKLGIKNFEAKFSQLKQHHLFDDFEKGIISPEGFRNEIRTIANIPFTDKQIDAAWNSILINLPQKNIDLLLRLKKSYRLFLLSNTNAIHEKAFTEMMFRDFGENVLEKTFERIYFSHNLHMRKPDEEIFNHVIKENDIVPSETLFIDDSPQHIEGAKKTGLQTFLVENGKTTSDFFNT
jgi:FMN phosphatase YigB (HAD superfamily)